jgi:hypothetical protein
MIRVKILELGDDLLHLVFSIESLENIVITTTSTAWEKKKRKKRRKKNENRK